MGCGLAAFALVALVQAVRYFSSPDILFPDFFGLWSFARFLQDHPPAQIYDNDALLAFQKEIGPGFDQIYPFLYPPPFLLLLWPFGQMPYVVARIAWIVAGLAAGLFAVCGRHWRRPLAVAALLAPATTVCVIYGQNGLLSAALMIGGIRLARPRPVLAGILFGALIYKPQLGLLIPVALAAAGLWRAFAAAAVTAAAILGASLIAYGWAMWPAWIAITRALQHLPASDRAHLDRLMPTVAAAMRRLGASADAANIVQALTAVGVAVVVWRCWRRGRDASAAATLPVATFLATPYAFDYDLPMVAFATLLGLQDWATRRASFGFGELLLVLLVLLLPVVFVSSISFGAPIAVALLAALLTRLAWDEA
jgi:hypothetical protein